jgi:DNA uptake protein ComE-like DNA-binding protein
VKNHSKSHRLAVPLHFSSAILLLVALASCVQPRNSEDLKEKTAEATANMKRDAKAVASGIREGWSRDKPLDLNTASKDDLTTLPGITAADADRIVDGRPYDAPIDLVDRRILSKAKYDQIADRVKAKK